MSEFTCANGHLMRSGQNTCPECGAKLTYMDGHSARELELMERDYDREQEEKEDEDEDADDCEIEADEEEENE